MIPRVLEARLLEAVAQMPAVAVTGPRQSGKTTLCRGCLPEHEHVSLEPLDVREFAVSDPRGFLRQHPGPVILDEAQRAPELFSYLQEELDRDPTPGRYVLTGSQHFGLSEAISQSLAGRVAVLHLLPLSLDEVRRFPSPPADLWETVWTGGYPRIHDRGLAPDRWLADYVATYVQRDVRQVLNVRDLDAFTALVRLAAGRTAQELHLSALGDDAGVRHPTVRSWLSVLEQSYLVLRAAAWLRNVGKRAVKAPKLHFVDSGLVCQLLGIRSSDQLRTHPLRGPIFESWVAAEIAKARVHRGVPHGLHHLRETRGVEVDVIVDAGTRLLGVEVKSAATLAGDFFRGLETFGRHLADRREAGEASLRLVYGGDQAQRRGGVEVVPWEGLHTRDWT